MCEEPLSFPIIPPHFLYLSLSISLYLSRVNHNSGTHTMSDQAVPEMDKKTQELIAAVLFVYNSYLNEEYGLDQMFGYEEDPLRNFLHTKTPGVPATFPDFFHELKFHYLSIKARMEREAKEGWVCDLVFDENTSEVGKVLGPSSKKRRVARE